MPVDWRPPDLPDDIASRKRACREADDEAAKKEARQRYSQRVFEVAAAFRRLVNEKQEKDRGDGRE